MSVTYTAKYKCSLCGMVYGSEKAGEKTAMIETVRVCVDTPFENNHIHKKIIHHCENGSMGVGHFIGFEKEEKADDKPYGEISF